MIKRISYILASAAVLLTACQQKLEFLHDLTLSNTTVNMPAQESWHVVAVYSNDDWTAFFPEPVEWASLDVVKGDAGIGRLQLDCSENLGLKRSVKVVVKSGTLTDTLKVNQYSGVKTPEFAFAKSSVEISGEAVNVSVGLSTNLGQDVERAAVSVTDAQGNNVDWVSSVSVMPEAVVFSVKKTVQDRQAVLLLTLSDSDGKTYTTSLTIIQNV
jgi:hypothetical protein